MSHTITQPDSIEIKLADGIFVKSMQCFEAGTLVPQHAHCYDHLSMLAVGSVRVWKNEELLGDFQAPTGIFIEANCKHKFLTLEPGTLIYCIHNIKDAEAVEIADEHHLSPNDPLTMGE